MIKFLRFFIRFFILFYAFLNFFGKIYAQNTNNIYSNIAKDWENKIQEMEQKIDFVQQEDSFEGWSLDSLQNILPYIKSEKIKCNWLILIGERYIAKYSTKASDLLEQAYQIAQKEDYTFGKYWVERTFASFFHQKGNVSKALEFLEKSEKNAQKITYQHGVALVYRTRGIVYERGDKPVLALQAFLKTIEIHEKTKNYNWLALDYWRLAIFYFKREDYKRGLNACERGEEYAKKNNYTKAIIRIYNWRGLLLEKQGNEKEALKYFDKSWQTLKNANYGTSDNERAIALYGMGANNVALFNKNPKDTIFANVALQYLEMCIDFQKQKFNSVNTDTYLKLAELYELLKNNQQAETFYQEAKKIAINNNTLVELGNIEEKLAKFYLKQNKIEQAQFTCENIIKFTQNNDLRKNALFAHKTLADIEAQKQNFSKAYFYQKKAQELQESLNLDQDQRKVARVEVEYELSQAQKEKDEQTQRIQILQNAEINYQKNLNIFFIVAFVVAIILTFLLLYYYRKQKKINTLLENQTKDNNKKNQQIEVQKQILEKAYIKSKKINEQLVILNNTIQNQKEELQINADALHTLNQELERSQEEVLAMNSNLELMIEERTKSLIETTEKLKESNKELETFLYHASHDLRRPLMRMIGLKNVAEMIFEYNYDNNKIKKEVLNLFEKADITAHEMDKMLMKLVMIDEVTQHRLGEDLEEIDFEQIVQEIKTKYLYFANDKEFVWEIKIQPNLNYIGQKRFMNIILEYILENSIDFANKSNPYILVKIETENQKLKITIMDNGQGIDSKEQHKIFNLYYRANIHSKGNGLGLYVVKKVVEKLNGNISFRSQKNAGTTFVVEI